MLTRNASVIAGVAAFVLIVAGWTMFARNRGQGIDLTIQTFDDCAAAGYPVAESYPATCRTSDGRTFVQEIPQEPPVTPPLAPLPPGPMTSPGGPDYEY
jgi:hypothetical protein